MITARFILQRSQQALHWIGSVCGSAAYKFYWDDGFSRASALAYTTLFALVPVTALSVSMFGVWGLDDSRLEATLSRIIEQIFPPMENEQIAELREQVLVNLHLLGLNIGALNVVSIAALVITSILFLNTIESALNVVWRATSEMTILSKIVNFWAVLTLGTLLIALSLAYTAQVDSFTDATPFLRTTMTYMVNFVVPVGITWGALSLLYYKLPSAPVRPQEAAFGGLIAAILFEIAKRGFAYYVGLSATYSKLYGVLVTIPLFLFWLYCTWVVVLFGAQISYQAGAIKILRGRQKYATDLGDVGAILGLRVLYIIGKKFVAGEISPTEAELAIETGSDPVLVRACLNLLAQNNMITVSDPSTHARSLLIPPDKLRVVDVLHTFFSKRQRAHLAREGNGAGGDEAMFLRLLSRAGINGDRVTDVNSWTLQTLLAAD